MIRRKVCSEFGIEADHVKSDKGTANLKLAYSKNQDGKGRGTSGMKKMKRSSLIKLSDMEALQSPPSNRSLSQSEKMLPLHVPTTAATPQKLKPLLRKSPNYMKPTSSSDAKKELLPVSLRNNRFGSDGKKNLPQKSLSKSKSSSAPNIKTARTMSRSYSVNMVRTLTKTLSFKPSRTYPRKPTATLLRADINAPYRATCSSTLKESKFPEHLMLNTGGSESEGALIMKVCPYTYCSLNGNHHPPEKRRFLKTWKSIKLEGSEKLKVPCETRKNFDIEPIVFDGKPACDEADRGNPTSITLIREIGIDFSIQVNNKEREKAYKMGRSDAVKHFEDQEGIKFAVQGNGDIAEEEGVYLVTPSVPCDLTKSEINHKVEFKNHFDASKIEAETKESFHQKLNAEDADKNHPPNWFYEGICTGSYSHEVTYDEEHMENIGLDDSNSRGTNMEWEEEQFCPVNHKEEDTGSSVITRETNSNFKSLSEGSHDIFEMRLDDILSNHYADNMVEKALQGKEEKNTYFDAQPRDTNFVQESTQVDYQSNSTDHEYDPPYLEEEEFQFPTNIEDNVREIEKHVDNGASCASMVLEEDTVHNSEAHKISETRKIEESREDSNTNLENNDKEIRQRNQILSSDVPDKSTIIVQDHKLLEEDQVTATKFQTICCKGGEGWNTSNNWQWRSKNKTIIQDVEEMRKINPRKPNFLPLVPDPEPEKVELRHQMIDDRKSTEEWMLDFSLRQAVTKLAPARKKKVALLVEAFETIISTSK